MEKIDSKDNLIRLVDQYKNLVFSICLKLTGDYFTAEDLTQETFIAAYKKYQSFDGNAEKAWICRIATNKCIDYLRSATVKNVELMSEEDMPQPATQTKDDPLNVYINKDTLCKLEKKCDELKEPYGSVIKLHLIEGMTAKEIALKRDEKLKTIQTQILRAKNMLKKSMNREELLS